MPFIKKFKIIKNETRVFLLFTIFKNCYRLDQITNDKVTKYLVGIYYFENKARKDKNGGGKHASNEQTFYTHETDGFALLNSKLLFTVRLFPKRSLFF